jgi:hypothetical protein
MNNNDLLYAVSRLQKELVDTGTIAYQNFNRIMEELGSDFRAEYDGNIPAAMAFLHLEIMKKLLEDKEDD